MASAFDFLPIILASQQADRANQAAEEQRKREQEQFDYFKKQNEADRAAMQPFLDSYKSMMEANFANAQKDRDRYDAVAIPLQNSLIADANSYASPERKMLEIGKATALVSNQMEGQRKSAIRNLESFGIDPSAARYGALDANARAMTGAAQAAAGNQASWQVDATARELRGQALNVLNGLPSQSLAGYGAALNTGNTAGNTTLGLTSSAAQTTGTPYQYAGLSNQALGVGNQALGLMNQGYQNYYGQQNAGGGSGWGSLLGMMAGTAAGAYFGGPAGAGAGSKLGSWLGGAATGGGSAGMASGSSGMQFPIANGSGGFSAGGWYAEGGAIPDHASPTGGAAIDDVPARLTAGEFVIPKDTLQWKGEEFFQKLIEQSRKAKDQAVAKPEIGVAPQEPPTFVSRPQGGALPVG